MDKTGNTYQDLISDLKEIIFGGTWSVILMYHELGVRLLEEKDLQMTRVAEDLGRSERTLYYAIQFAKEYPDINKLPKGKAITWRQIRNQLLAGKSIDCSHEEVKEISICSHCGKRIKLKDL